MTDRRAAFRHSALMENEAAGGPLRIGPVLAHTVLICVPGTAFPAALALDLAFAAGAWPGAGAASQWCLAIGVGVALIAGLVGGLDYASHPRIAEHRFAGAHIGLAMTLLTMEAVNSLMRYSNGDAIIVSAGLPLSLASVALMALLIWLGRRVVRDLRPAG